MPFGTGFEESAAEELQQASLTVADWIRIAGEQTRNLSCLARKATHSFDSMMLQQLFVSLCIIMKHARKQAQNVMQPSDATDT